MSAVSFHQGSRRCRRRSRCRFGGQRAGADHRAEAVAFRAAASTPSTNGSMAWAEQLEKESNGRLKITIYPNGQLVGPPNRQFDAARNGITDIAWVLHGVTPGRYPMTELANLPFAWQGPAPTSSRPSKRHDRAGAEISRRRAHRAAHPVHGDGQSGRGLLQDADHQARRLQGHEDPLCRPRTNKVVLRRARRHHRCWCRRRSRRTRWPRASSSGAMFPHEGGRRLRSRRRRPNTPLDPGMASAPFVDGDESGEVQLAAAGPEGADRQGPAAPPRPRIRQGAGQAPGAARPRAEIIKQGVTDQHPVGCRRRRAQGAMPAADRRGGRRGSTRTASPAKAFMAEYTEIALQARGRRAGCTRRHSGGPMSIGHRFRSRRLGRSAPALARRRGADRPDDGDGGRRVHALCCSTARSAAPTISSRSMLLIFVFHGMADRLLRAASNIVIDMHRRVRRRRASSRSWSASPTCCRSSRSVCCRLGDDRAGPAGLPLRRRASSNCRFRSTGCGSSALLGMAGTHVLRGRRAVGAPGDGHHGGHAG